MIKLIASDLDGTLLYGRDNTVSEEMFELIRELKNNGIIFAAASGRQYHNLKKLFAPVWQDMAFICENGATVFYEDKIIAEQIVPKEELLDLVYMIDADERAEVALSSSTTTYVSWKPCGGGERVGGCNGAVCKSCLVRKRRCGASSGLLE